MIKRHADDVTIDYIIRLRKLVEENERLREALKNIVCNCEVPCNEILSCNNWKARAALKESE